MAIDRNLLSGGTTMLLLKLLEEKDMYGYEMIENLRLRSNDVFDLKAGTLYPLLHGLEEKGYLTSYEQAAAGKLRKYYSLTKSGRRFLTQKQEEWRQYSGAVEQVLGKSTLALDGVGKLSRGKGAWTLTGSGKTGMGGVGFAGI